jgi:hypothetical protein
VNERGQFAADLGPDVPPDEVDALVAVGHRLRAGRGVPRATFRGDLRRRLVAQQGARPAPPAGLRLLIAAAGTSGAALLLFAAASVAGAGPLAA